MAVRQITTEISIKNEAEFRFATALSARSASLAYNKDVNKRGLCHGAVRTERRGAAEEAGHFTAAV